MSRQKKKSAVWISIILFAGMLILASATTREHTAGQVLAYYKDHLDSLKQSVTNMQSALAITDQSSMRDKFRQARHYYKKIEFLVEYHFPETAVKLNAPNLPEAKVSTPAETLYPTGFQVLEEALFDDDIYDRNLVASEISGILFAVNRLEGTVHDMELNESNILDAIKLNLYRLIIKGITGFDSPVALNSIDEAVSSLEGTVETLQYFSGNTTIVQSAVQAWFYLQRYEGDFDGFDRAAFVVSYINPLCNALYEYQVAASIPFSLTPPKAIPASVPNLFSEQAFDLKYFAPAHALPLDTMAIALGRRLFNDPVLSVGNKRSCASCHQPEKAFTDGKQLNESLLNGKQLLRNTPSLINAALQPVQFYDSRVAFLEDQVHDVIANPSEMGGVFHVITSKMARDKSYRKLFKAVFHEDRISERHIKAAIAAYVRSLVAMNSPFDQYMRGDTTAMSIQAVEGFNLFMGKAKCGTCHFMPLFNGTVPPLFEKMESEVLGVPAGADTLHAVLDADSGKYNIYGIPHQLYAFKTTTVRNSAVTAPYMHNGVYQTLEEVIDFYNRGGGAGLGFEVAHQTLPPDRLDLTRQERDHIIAFLHALTDTTSFKKKR